MATGNISWQNRVELFCCYEWTLKSFDLKTELVSAQQFGKISGYENWHRRLEHTLAPTIGGEIQDSIKHVEERKELLVTTYETHTKMLCHA
jgi:hypothetical protein